MERNRGCLTMIYLIIFGLLLIGLGLPSAAFLLIAQTVRGWMLGLFGMGLTLLPALLALAHHSNSDRARRITQITGGVVAALVLSILITTPGQGRPDGDLTVEFTTDARFPRWSLANVIPEVEQINLGFYTMPLVDPYIDFPQAQRVGPATRELYREMNQDPDFRRSGSAMPLVYRELWGADIDQGHYYLYASQALRDGQTANQAVLFLHGALGNFKTYTWVWSKLAGDEMAIIAPTYGMGFWPHPEGTQIALDALADARQQISTEQIVLAGISNGGLGVTRTASVASEDIAALIFISPVFDDDILYSSNFQALWTGRPVLIMTGEDDRRVSVEYVRDRAAMMQSAGMDVTLIDYPDADHFLFFTHEEQVLSDIHAWLETLR